jgi:hypothetical protein
MASRDFCDVEDHGATGGCQSNCEQPGPKKKDTEQLDRVIGYYEAWRYKSQCQGMVSEPSFDICTPGIGSPMLIDLHRVWTTFRSIH